MGNTIATFSCSLAYPCRHRITAFDVMHLFLCLFTGEKKRLLKVTKTKKFRAIKPWIGVKFGRKIFYFRLHVYHQ